MTPRMLLAAASLLLGCGITAEIVQDKNASSRPTTTNDVVVFDAKGALLRPKGYRSFVQVGTPLTPNDMNDGKAAFPEFHSVYVDPQSYEHWRKTGTWRDGTLVLKELVSVAGKSATSGKGYFMGEFIGLEAVVKSKSRFPDAPGNWGFFRFTDEKGGPVHDKALVLPEASCASCHAAAADDDLIFTQYYPVLRVAKNFGDGRPEDR